MLDNTTMPTTSNTGLFSEKLNEHILGRYYHGAMSLSTFHTTACIELDTSVSVSKRILEDHSL